MARLWRFLVLIQCVLIFSANSSDVEKKEKYLRSLINYLNNLPNASFNYEDGFLLNVQDTGKGDEVEAIVKATDLQDGDSVKVFKCQALMVTHDADQVAVNQHRCLEVEEKINHATESELQEEYTQVAEPLAVQKVNLENEVQPDNSVTSGEQFIAIPRIVPVSPCVGCSSNVDVTAPGVNDLAQMGLQHLDRHNPTHKHTLDAVIEVQRQVQVVNGVRFILTLNINFNNCTEFQNKDCQEQKLCKISILEKPWIKLPNGSKFRAVVSNNCTEEWLFHENEDLPTQPESNDNIKAIHDSGLQSQIVTEKKISEEELKNIEKQIIPNNNIKNDTTDGEHADIVHISANDKIGEVIDNKNQEIVKRNDNKSEASKNPDESASSNEEESNSQPISEGKKRAIDDLINFFDSADPSLKKVEYRVKRNIITNVGSIVERDPNKMEYIFLAHKSLAKYLSSSTGTYYRINKIHKVTTQTVEGTLTKIDFDIAPMFNTNLDDMLYCHSEIWHRPWLSQQEEIKVNCTEGSKSKRSAVVGGQTEQDPSEEKYKILAEKSLMKYQIQMSDPKNVHKIVAINKVTTQVVAGVITRIDFDISPLLNSDIVLHCHSEIWQRPWLPNSEEITVKCREGSRSKRAAIYGGETEQDPTDEKYKVLAEKSLMKYHTQLSDTKTLHKIVAINKVTTQVVAGLKTRIDFDISPLLNSDVVLHCHSEILERPWLPNSEEITVKCNEAARSKRERMHGGQIIQDPSDVKYKILAEKSLMKYQSRLSVTKNVHKIVAIKKVTTQIVSGVITRIDFDISPLLNSDVVLHCHSEIWQRPWMANSEEIIVKCNKGARGKRETMPGGQTDQDPSDEKYKILAEKSLMKYQLQLSDPKNVHKIVAINKVTTQVVAGVITRIDFDISPLLNSDVVLQCHSEIWERPWLPNSEEITIKCSERSRSKRETIVGGETEQDPTDEKYKVLAEKSLMKYHTQLSDPKNLHKIVAINKVTTQVVAGVITRIDFDISPLLNSDVVLHCHSEIWQRPWLPNSEEITVKCSEGSRSKRAAIYGGETEQDPTDEKYKVLAEKSLMKYYTQLSDPKNLHKIIAINKVTTQVVAGLKTRIDFDISPLLNSDVVLHCHSVILEKPWLPNSEEITVKCSEGVRGKRETMPGGQSDEDPSDEKYKILAEKSLMKYHTQLSDPKNLHKIVAINKVTTQVVAGVITRIDFDISPLLNSDVVLHCHSEIWERPWLPNSDEITVKCSEGARGKRETMPGGQSDEDPSDEKYKILAEKSLMKYQTQLSDPKNVYKIVAINKVTTQVVAGVITRIDFDISPLLNSDVVHCHSEIWERPWLPNSEEITVKCSEGSRSKRATIVGGETEQDPTDEKYKVLAEKSLMKYHTQLSDPKNLHKIVAINKVTTQVVAGVITRIDFDISPLLNSDVVLHCHSEIWERPWLPNSEEITVKCSEGSRSKRETIVGGETEQDPSDEKYKILAEKSLMKYQTQLSGPKKLHKIVAINKVTTQVVAGLKTRIDFDISPLLNSDVVLHCHSVILERPWLPNSEEITVTCNEAARSKRETIVGGETEQDPFDKKYKIMAEKALKKYQKEANLEEHKIIAINKVTTQLVAGLLTRIDFDILPVVDFFGYVILHCHSQTLERPWKPNPEEITIKCDPETLSRPKRAVNLGVPVEQNPGRKEFIELAEKSLKLFYQSNDSDNLHKVVNVTKVTIQAVSGTITRIDFDISPTICSKEDMRLPAGGDCLLKGDTPEVYSCHSEIWNRPWLPHGEEMTIKCKHNNNHYYNENTEITKLPIDISLLAEEALTKYERMAKSKYAHKIVKFNKITNIVNEYISRFDFMITPTTCLIKDIDGLSRSECDAQKPIFERQCRAEIWKRPWLTKSTKEITVSCDLNLLIDGITKDPRDVYTTDREKRYPHINEYLRNNNNSSRNTAIGLYIDYRPLESHPKEAELAKGLSNEVLKHVEAQYPYLYKQKVLRVFSLRKHRISEERYKVKFEVGYTNCSALSFRRDCKVIDTDAKILCKGDVSLAHDAIDVNHVSCEEKDHNTDIYEHIQADYLFREFVTNYKPSYKDDRAEMGKRYKIFKDNIKKMHQFNTLDTGTATYGVTRFSDLTYEEFNNRHMGLRMDLRDGNQVPMSEASIPNIDVPDKFDWRDQGAVTEVKNQGSCGSCWAFSVTGNIEGQWKLKKGELLSLSEQELVDCDKVDHGCNGGLPDNAYRVIEKLGGLETESDYPYEGAEDKCKFNTTMAKVQITGAVNITSNEDDMAKWLTKNGPISIGINANAMQFYIGGVSHPWRMLCNPENLDHGVLIVGYGTKEYPVFKKNLPYWTIKNSWGTGWGEQGYYRVFRGDGTCGVNKMASSAIV